MLELGIKEIIKEVKKWWFCCINLEEDGSY